MWDSELVLGFVVRYFVHSRCAIILMGTRERERERDRERERERERERLLCLVCLPGVS